MTSEAVDARSRRTRRTLTRRTLGLIVIAALLAAAAWHYRSRFADPMPRADIDAVADVDGMKLAYLIYNPGGGSPVFLLHGGLGSAYDWRKTIPALVGNHEVITPDARGQGESTRGDGPMSYHRMAEDTLALMDKLKIERAAVVGWSDGGNIGIDLAIHHPERVSRLFTYGANYSAAGMFPIDPPSLLHRMKDAVERLFSEHARTVADIIAMWQNDPYFTEAELKGIHVPVMIADGEFDEAIRPEHTKALAALIPGAQLVILPKLTHEGLLEDPATFNRILTGFLNAGATTPSG